MGASGSNDGGSNDEDSSSSGRTSGLDQHCYNVGYDHGSMSFDADPVGDGIDAFPCTLNESANESYARGYEDAVDASGYSGVSSGDSGDNTKSGYPSARSEDADGYEISLGTEREKKRDITTSSEIDNYKYVHIEKGKLRVLVPPPNYGSCIYININHYHPIPGGALPYTGAHDITATFVCQGTKNGKAYYVNNNGVFLWCDHNDIYLFGKRGFTDDYKIWKRGGLHETAENDHLAIGWVCLECNSNIESHKVYIRGSGPDFRPPYTHIMECDKNGMLIAPPAKPVEGKQSILSRTVPPKKNIKINIKVKLGDLDGDFRIVTANITNMDNLDAIKKVIQTHDLIPFDKQKIYHNDMLLEGNNAIYAYGIKDNDIVNTVSLNLKPDKSGKCTKCHKIVDHHVWKDGWKCALYYGLCDDCHDVHVKKRNQRICEKCGEAEEFHLWNDGWTGYCYDGLCECCTLNKSDFSGDKIELVISGLKLADSQLKRASKEYDDYLTANTGLCPPVYDTRRLKDLPWYPKYCELWRNQSRAQTKVRQMKKRLEELSKEKVTLGKELNKVITDRTLNEIENKKIQPEIQQCIHMIQVYSRIGNRNIAMKNQYEKRLKQINDAIKANRDSYLDKIKSVVVRGADVNYPYIYKVRVNNDNTPLNIASANGFTDIVEYLLDNGAEIDGHGVDKQNGNTPLSFAMKRKGTESNLDTVKLLLKRGANVNIVKNRNYSIIQKARELLKEEAREIERRIAEKKRKEKEAEEDAKEIVRRIAEEERLRSERKCDIEGIDEKIELLMTEIKLAKIQYEKDLKIYEDYLKSKGITVYQVNEYRKSPWFQEYHKLWRNEADARDKLTNTRKRLENLLTEKVYLGKKLVNAIRENNFTEVKIFIACGADVNYPLFRGDIINYDKTPLCMACRKGHMNIIKYLLDNGADINAHYPKLIQPPLLTAMGGGNHDMAATIRFLLSRGANSNVELFDMFNYRNGHKYLKGQKIL